MKTMYSLVISMTMLWPGTMCQALPGEWELIRVDAQEAGFRSIIVHPTQPQWLVAASQRALYHSSDGGNSWRLRFSLPGVAQATGVAISPDSPTVLVATDQGVYASFDAMDHWSLTTRGVGEAHASCTHVAFHPTRPETVLLTTNTGLLISTDGGRTWVKQRVPATSVPWVHVAVDPRNPDRLYLLSRESLFVGSMTNGDWQLRVRALDAEDAEVEEPDVLEAIETERESGSLHRLSAVALDPQHPSTIYLGSSRGLSRSADDGITWQQLTGMGMLSPAIARLLPYAHSPLVLYAATPRGVARYDPLTDRWRNLTTGLAASIVNDLAVTPTHLWAATDDGMFRYEIAPETFGESEPPSPQDLLANFVHEPTIAQVRDAAVRYAEVHPDKIRRWRRQAAFQALLPSIDVGFDRDRSDDIRIDEGSFPNFQLIETKDRDAGLDLSVTWDLSELIWNDDQTSIDVRSKLMVQLRDDIVDQVTRTYFERRRLQVQLLTEPPTDQQKLLDKELRLQELTAVLDGMTDGFFSKHTTPQQPQEER